jgi:hypothetical protein
MPIKPDSPHSSWRRALLRQRTSELLDVEHRFAVAGVPYDEAAIVDLRWRATTCWEEVSLQTASAFACTLKPS